MRNRAHAIATLTVAALATVLLAACGSSSSSSSSSGSSSSSSSGSSSTLPLKAGENPSTETLYGKKKGGTLTVYSSVDFAHLDPGESYFGGDYPVVDVTNRPLFLFAPNASTTVVPDLATTVPTLSNGGITDGGKTVTVHIQPNVRFSPPVNRVVTSKDVAYAIERGANPNVANPYFISYFGANSPAPLVGATSPKYSGGPIPGIQTPNNTTIVFHMTKPGAAILVPALGLPTSAPVPESFAGPLDKKSPTTYGTQYLVATGPYMIQANNKTGQFAGIGYQTGKSLTLVRNPNWSASTYSSAFRPPAYLNQINYKIGVDATVAQLQTLKGSDAVEMDQATPPNLKLAYQKYPSQLTVTAGSGDWYIGVDNAHGVFTNVNLRKAFWAALDRAAILKVVGGPLEGQVMTHFIYPGTAGFQQAGGYTGPQVDYNQDPNGNLTVATKYMKLAGYKTGKYTGNQTVQLVGADNGVDPAWTQVVDSALTSLGFKVHASEPDQSVMYTKYCEVPKQEIDACPIVGWIRDFADPFAVLYVPFYGPAIVSSNNSNFGQFNNPSVNAAMRQASLIVAPAARAQAWANIDKMLVANAAAIPEYFANEDVVASKNVNGVVDQWNQGLFDFEFTSLTNP
jgi:peptide/nickel transport system substrate-binding protein